VRRSRGDFCLLQGIAGNSRIAELAQLALVERFDNASFDFAGGWETAYREKISKRHRQDYRRKRQLLGELGHLETKVARSAGELDAVLDETVRLHELRWGGRYDASGYAEPEVRLATRDAVARLAARGSYRIVTLDLDGTPIAFVSFFVVAGSAVGHRTGFDPTYGDHSPGALVFFDAFAACEADGITRFEFGGGDDRYKRALADVVEPLFDGIGLARGVRGVLAAEAYKQVLVQGRRMRRSPRVRAAYKRARDVVHR
jgi:CelD/BcsL family acetyltransferase involved in cellulose biosynthesis